MRWLHGAALMSIVVVAIMLGVSLLRMTSRALPPVPTRGPVTTLEEAPDQAVVKTVIPLLMTMQPTLTPTRRPTFPPLPTATRLPWCYGEATPRAGRRCDPRSPTPDVAPTQVVTVSPLYCSTAEARATAGMIVPSSCVWEG